MVRQVHHERNVTAPLILSLSKDGIGMVRQAHHERNVAAPLILSLSKDGIGVVRQAHHERKGHNPLTISGIISGLLSGRGGFITRPTFNGKEIPENGRALAHILRHPSQGGLQTRPYVDGNTNHKTVVPAKAGIQNPR